jgi:hypothetical protein
MLSHSPTAIKHQAETYYARTRLSRFGFRTSLSSITLSGLSSCYLNKMAPDLNSVPPSPRPAASSPHISSRTASRRASQQMGPPPLPPSSPSYNILPSNQNAVNQASSPMASPTIPLSMAAGIGDNTGVGTGPGPLRHPRPMTAADLHLELEKEQEAVVCSGCDFDRSMLNITRSID